MIKSQYSKIYKLPLLIVGFLFSSDLLIADNLDGSCPTNVRSARLDFHPDVIDWLRADLLGSGSIIIEDAKGRGYKHGDDVCVYNRKTNETILCSKTYSTTSADVRSLYKSKEGGFNIDTDLSINVRGFGNRTGVGAAWRSYIEKINSSSLNTSKTYLSNVQTQVLQFNVPILLSHIKSDLIVKNMSRPSTSCQETGSSSHNSACSQRYSYQNSQNRFDVNNDGNISAVDALNVINFLNSGGSINTCLPPNAHVDVDGNGVVSAVDALQIINKLNAK